MKNPPTVTTVVAVHVSQKHSFSKASQAEIRLIQNFGVEGDAHAGATDQHIYHVRRFGQRPNLRQVHLIQSELLDEVGDKGHTVRPGELGENISTRGIDLLSLPTGTRLHIGPQAVIELTGLRNPCVQIEKFQPGLLKHLVVAQATGLVRRAGVMSIVLNGGPVYPGDAIEVVLPPLPHQPLIYRVPELEVRIEAMREEARGILSLELRTTDGSLLPPFSAGAHVDLMLAPGLTRSYSLSNDPQERHRYVVTVCLAPESRGGSRHVHEQLKVGGRITISPPRNNFQLDETAAHTVLIAGGIGIKPLMAMIARLESLGQRWSLYYACKDRGSAAFVEALAQLEQAAPGRVHVRFSAGQQGARFDLKGIVAAEPASAHFYCCGPESMVASFEAATAELPKPQVHVERFAASAGPAREGGFSVVLQRSKQTLPVARGHTILDTLLAAKVEVPYACREGVCGSCKLKVLEGIPDHRDAVLTPEERDRHDQLMTCCSGSLSPVLVIDL